MIQALPIFQDNYIWLIHHEQGFAVIDPGLALPVLKALPEKAELTHILITHHHADHIGGISELLHHYPHAKVVGPSSLMTVTYPVQQGDCLALPPYRFEVMAVPAHTLDHLAYYSLGHLFTGDTLFGAGCGRLFEGTAAQMLNALSAFMCLPPDTKIYPAHEYTLRNLAFAQQVEPNNVAIQTRFLDDQQRLQTLGTTLPSTLAIEMATNPFLRCHLPSIYKTLGFNNANETLAVFSTLREKRNLF